MSSGSKIFSEIVPPRNEYEAWRDMLNSVINFICASTTLVDNLSNSFEMSHANYINTPEISNIRKFKPPNICKEFTCPVEVFPTDFPWFMEELARIETMISNQWCVDNLKIEYVDDEDMELEPSCTTKVPKTERGDFSETHVNSSAEIDLISFDYSDSSINQSNIEGSASQQAEELLIKMEEKLPESLRIEERAGETSENYSESEENDPAGSTPEKNELIEDKQKFKGILPKTTNKCKNNIKALISCPSELRKPLKEAIVLLEEKENGKRKMHKKLVANEVPRSVDIGDIDKYNKEMTDKLNAKMREFQNSITSIKKMISEGKIEKTSELDLEKKKPKQNQQQVKHFKSVKPPVKLKNAVKEPKTVAVGSQANIEDYPVETLVPSTQTISKIKPLTKSKICQKFTPKNKGVSRTKSPDDTDVNKSPKTVSQKSVRATPKKPGEINQKDVPKNATGKTSKCMVAPSQNKSTEKKPNTNNESAKIIYKPRTVNKPNYHVLPKVNNVITETKPTTGRKPSKTHTKTTKNEAKSSKLDDELPLKTVQKNIKASDLHDGKLQSTSLLMEERNIRKILEKKIMENVFKQETLHNDAKRLAGKGGPKLEREQDKLEAETLTQKLTTSEKNKKKAQVKKWRL